MLSQVGYHAIGVRTARHWSTNLFRLRLFKRLFLLVFESSNQIDALLDRANWSYLVVHFHRFELALNWDASPARVRSHRPIKEFALSAISLVIISTLHHCKLVAPALSQPKVFAWFRKCLWLTFPYWHSCFFHKFAHILMWFLLENLYELLRFCIIFAVDLSNSRQIIWGVCVSKSEGRCELFGFLIEVLAIKRVHFFVFHAISHCKSIVPFLLLNLFLNNSSASNHEPFSLRIGHCLALNFKSVAWFFIILLLNCNFGGILTRL